MLLLVVITAAVMAAMPRNAFGQETLSAAKDLYGSAAYQDALAMLDRLKSSQTPPDQALEIDKYRLFCLYALGKTTDAEQAIVGILATRPRFSLDENEASPRVLAAFRAVRRAQMPAVIQQAYARGRDAYEAKDLTTAEAQFRTVLDLASDPDAPADSSSIRDARTLAAGFLALIEGTKAAAEPKPTPVEPPPPPPAAAPPYYTIADKDVTPPSVIRQDVPSWPSGIRMTGAKGVLELVISEKGDVESAVMRIRIHPIFDAILVDSARKWKYRPAMRGSEPVKYLRRIEVDTAYPRTQTTSAPRLEDRY